FAEDGKIKSYQILAPTEWNFHPQGVLSRMIEAVTYKNEQDLVNQIKLLVDVVDPCVGYSIEIDRL
ncbi:MAG: nickel-dependent hydrogenase large subunit, partial [Candidatus Thioglobus sp.]